MSEKVTVKSVQHVPAPCLTIRNKPQWVAVPHPNRQDAHDKIRQFTLSVIQLGMAL